MGCHFTEEVSLLVDGELAPHEAARLGAHIEGCAACKQAREAFLLFRQELRAYDWVPDPHAQSRALASILGSHTSGVETATPSANVRAAGRSSTPREQVKRLSERLAEAFSVRRLRPAHVATLALLLIGIVLGVRWFTGSNTSSRPQPSGASALANANRLPVQAEAGGTRSESPDVVNNQTVREAETPKSPRPTVTASNPRAGREEARGRHRARHQGRAGLSRDMRLEMARVAEPDTRPSSATVNALYATESLRAADDPALRIGRHAERVERLLRSFRNARLTQGDPTLDVADARRLSKRLLYNNIALRREAAGTGDLPVEGLLDSVEPILIEISNLPNAPSQKAVGSIKERINRRQLVGVLQTQGMLAAR
jgi:Putative zinc-finger